MKTIKLAYHGRKAHFKAGGGRTAGLPVVMLVLVAFCLSAVPVRSADTYIRDIVVVGNKQVSTNKIRRVMRLDVGDRYDRNQLQKALKRLFATKQFAYIQAHRDDTAPLDSVTVTVRVEEHTKVEGVRYDGNEHVDKEDLEKVISVGEGSFVRPAMISRDKEAISDLYKEKGYFRVAVEESLTVDPELRSRILVYRIVEGAKVSLEHMDFIGVRALDTGDIRGVMSTKENGWLRGGDYKPKEFEADKEEIINLYRTKGFLDARIKDTKMVFSSDSKELDLFITIEEGTKYSVGGVTWNGNELFPDTTIEKFMTMEKGDVFDDSEFNFVRDGISALYAERGYIYCTVSPLKDVKGDVIDVNFEIVEGTPAHVREINIAGNTKTYEEVIRRELVLAPGDVFLRSRLMRSLREVFNLGYFAGPPQVIPGQPDDNGDVDITLRVEEKPVGQFRLGAGFSQLNKVSGFIGVQEPNLFGRGLNVGFNWEFSKYRQNINLSLTEPWFMGTPTEVSGSVYSHIQNQVQQQFFTDRRTGASLRVGRPFPWFDYTSVFVRYSYEMVELSNFAEGYTGVLRNTDWPQGTSAIGLTVLRNSTDNPFHPTIGTRTVINSRWTGGTLLGGDVRFQKYEVDFRAYQSLFWRFVLEVRNVFGILDGYESPGQVPDYEKFRLGGNRRWGLRGYDFYEVVPKGNPQYIGGRVMQISTLEVSFPIAGPTVYGLFFAEGGNTWNSFQETTLFELRKGVGMGIRIELPMLGTVGLDYGYGIDKPGGASWEPHITFGGMF